MRLALRLIEEDGGTQSRAELDREKVTEYSEVLDQLPPVIVFYDGAKYWLADGFHRVAAAMNLEANDLEVDVRQGTLRDAIFFSLSANASHGIPRSNGDKRRAVERMLADEEWGAWSDVKIAEVCRVGRHFVAKVRAELSSPKVSHLDPDPGESRQRKYVTKHGTEAVMNIGPPPAPPAQPLPRVDEELHLAASLEGRIERLVADIQGASPRVQHLIRPVLDTAVRQLARLTHVSAA